MTVFPNTNQSKEATAVAATARSVTAKCKGTTVDSRIIRPYRVYSYEAINVALKCSNGYACAVDYDSPYPMACLVDNGAKDGSSDGRMTCWLFDPFPNERCLTIRGLTCCESSGD